jgi:exosome complex component CSL4
MEDFVTPGEKIGVIEEFQPGEGTYTKNGIIYAENLGKVSVDLKKRKISVISEAKVHVPVKGDIVLGEVQQVQDKIATIKIFKVNEVELRRSYTAILHVSFATKNFLKTLYDALRPGDMIRARIIGDENLPYQLTMTDKDLGVIVAYCTFCGKPLKYDRRAKKLVCTKCRRAERRKLSSMYGKI